MGEVFEEYSEKNHEELPALTIIQGGGTILREESDRALQYDKSSLSNYKMVKKDDFIVHLRSFEGGLEKANTDGIISPAYHTFHGDNTDSRFYYPFFRSRRFIDVLLKPHVYGIRDGKSIDIEGMKSIMIPVPSYNEQKAIGGYIETLDNLITLHQLKLKCINLHIYRRITMDHFEKEADFERALITALQSYGWEKKVIYIKIAVAKEIQVPHSTVGFVLATVVFQVEILSRLGWKMVSDTSSKLYRSPKRSSAPSA